jgi:hypothetical protein
VAIGLGLSSLSAQRDLGRWTFDALDGLPTSIRNASHRHCAGRAIGRLDDKNFSVRAH